MKVEQIIDEMQALMTKLRGRLRDKETVEFSPAIDPHRCFVCGIPADMGIGNALGAQIGYCRKHMPQRATDTARECTGHVASCPIHGKHGKDAYRQWIQGCPSPDLPLHARVAKAVGKKIFKSQIGDYHLVDSDLALNGLVPDYPNDLVAVMGALEEYCQKLETPSSHWTMEREALCVKIWIVREFYEYYNMSIPQAICEAIVAHAEGK